MKFSSLLLITFLFFSCKEKPKAQNLVEKPKVEIKHAVIADSAMVVSARAEASRIGVEILKKGGNAFDAMIATNMALALTYPNAGNLGGGGFMVYRTQYGEIGSLDYREKAPMAATKNMYLDKDGNVIPRQKLDWRNVRGCSGNRCRNVCGSRKIWKFTHGSYFETRN